MRKHDGWKRTRDRQERGAAMTTLTSACNTSESPFLSLASQLESIHVMLPIQLYTTMRSNGGCAEPNLKQLDRT